MPQQETLMRFDPATGYPQPYPSNAEQWREHHGEVAWRVNPWTEEKRPATDVGSDPFGHLIVPPGEPALADNSTIEIKIDLDALGKAITETLAKIDRGWIITRLKTDIKLCGDDIAKIATVCGNFAKANAAL